MREIDIFSAREIRRDETWRTFPNFQHIQLCVQSNVLYLATTGHFSKQDVEGCALFFNLKAAIPNQRSFIDGQSIIPTS